MFKYLYRYLEAFGTVGPRFHLSPRFQECFQILTMLKSFYPLKSSLRYMLRSWPLAVRQEK